MENTIKWLVANDRRLWVDRPRIRDAIKECKEATGEDVSAKVFRDLRDEHCKFWFKEGFNHPCRATALSERQWSRVREFLTSNWSFLSGSSEGFIIRYARLCGIPLNIQLLSGCQTYKELIKDGGK